MYAALMIFVRQRRGDREPHVGREPQVEDLCPIPNRAHTVGTKSQQPITTEQISHKMAM